MLSLIAIVLGAYTRLVDAGLGCPDWPGCYGFFTAPDSAADVAVAEDRFPNSPVEPDKAWTEMVHRYAASLLGISILVVLAIAVKERQNLTLPILLTVLVITQGVIGAWTVTLKLWPQIVTLHLLGGFATAGLLWYYLLDLGLTKLQPIPARSVRVGHVVAMLLFVQIAIGGWTTSNYAALACPDFPLCHGELLPDMDIAKGFNVMQSIGPNYLGGELSNEARIAIQVAHRLGAIVFVIAAVILVVRLSGSIRYVLAVGVFFQFSLGICNVVFNLPLAVATAHNFGALLLVLIVISILHPGRTRSSAG